jgi:aminopeptidase N
VTAPARSLQQQEAIERKALLTVESYDVRLDLASDPATFGSVTTIRFTSAGGPTFVDLKPAAVHGIALNGRPVDANLLERGRLPIDTVAGSNELVVDAVMRFRNDGEGLHRSVDPADGQHYVYGMSFMDAAPTIFACFDQPDLKAPYTFHVTAPVGWTVIGNSPAEEVDAGPGGSVLWELATTPPLSTYFVTIVAGPYHVVRDQHDGIPLGLSARASLAAHLDKDAEELFTLTRQCFDEFHRLFGIRYPFGDYHQAFVPEFNAGAMENPGCVTFRDNLVFASRVTRGARIQRATTIAHEMAHQWFGNIVTPRWWDDLWLNESFAEYLGNRVTADVTEYADAWTHVAYARRQWGLVADQRPTTHPVAGNGAVDAVAALQSFDGISYAKGSTILKQVDARIGDEVFFAGAVDHMTTHRFDNATMHDLFGSWERAGAGDLSAFIDGWLLTAGPDTITLDRPAGMVRRTPPVEHPADRAHTLHVATAAEGNWELAPLGITGPETALDVAGRPLVFDPENETWAVFAPDAVTVDALQQLLPAVTDAALRAAVWNNVRSGHHNALLDPADVVELAVASPPVEDTDDSARHTMPWLLSQVLPLAPAGSLARLHEAFTRRLPEAEPGSERQLSTFRGAIRTATSPELLAAWRDGERLPEGLPLDLDLRWRVLVRLATLGAVTREELDRTLADEPTTVARVEHTRAVASLPTAEAKAFAWERFIGAVDVPNYELEAAGLGMWRGGQEHLTRPYVDRYFAELPATVEVRSGWVLALAAEAFYPLSHADEHTLGLAQALLADPDALPPSVRKRVVDMTDETARRIAIRAAYPHG